MYKLGDKYKCIRSITLGSCKYYAGQIYTVEVGLRGLNHPLGIYPQEGVSYFVCTCHNTEDIQENFRLIKARTKPMTALEEIEWLAGDRD